MNVQETAGSSRKQPIPVLLASHCYCYVVVSARFIASITQFSIITATNYQVLTPCINERYVLVVGHEGVSSLSFHRTMPVLRIPILIWIRHVSSKTDTFCNE
jgi:hypothetical protein